MYSIHKIGILTCETLFHRAENLVTKEAKHFHSIFDSFTTFLYYALRVCLYIEIKHYKSIITIRIML